MAFKIILINLLTLIRIIGTIILIPVYRKMGGFVVGLVSLICYLTDSVDGILARKFHASTFFGALFDGVADKLFTIINFVVLFLITPYALIPIIFEILIIIVQFIKYKKNMNVQSNIIGKAKVWVLAICVVATFMASDIANISFLSMNFRNSILALEDSKLYFWLLFPATVMEIITFISYILESFLPNKEILTTKELNREKEELKSQNMWENFKYIWLNPEYYEKHKNDAYLRKIVKIKK